MTTVPKRTEHNLIVCSGKSEAEVNDNRRLRSRYCTIEANYWQILWRNFVWKSLNIH